ncbi:MAG: phytanoyl-CoA dioxygenase family protein [Halioglobus sp.]
MNYSLLAEKFWRDGYIILDNFFNDALMNEYQALILQHFGEAPEFLHNEEFLSKAATEVIPWFPQQEGLDTFDTVQEDPRLLDLTAALLGSGWKSLYCMTMFSMKGTKGQAWHQDCAPDDAAVFNVNRLVYTEDISPAIGGQTIVIPGSHRRGELTVGPVDEDFADQVTLTPTKGTLIMLHGHTWHRVLPVTGRYRVSTNYRCCPQGTPEDVTDICVYRNMRYRFETNTVVQDRLTTRE